MPLPEFDSIAFDELRDVVTELVDTRGELAELEMDRARQRADTLAMSAADSVSASEREAEINTVDTRVDIINLRAHVAGLEDRRDFLTAWMVAASKGA